MYCILYDLFPILHYNGGTESLPLRAYGYTDGSNYRNSMPTLSYEGQVKHGSSRAPASLSPIHLTSLSSTQVWLCHLWGSAQKENVRAPVQKSPKSFPLLPRLSLSVCHGIYLFVYV